MSSQFTDLNLVCAGLARLGGTPPLSQLIPFIPLCHGF